MLILLRVSSKSALFGQKCVTYITSCYICYMCELHPIQIIDFFLILSFDNF